LMRNTCPLSLKKLTSDLSIKTRDKIITRDQIKTREQIT